MHDNDAFSHPLFLDTSPQPILQTLSSFVGTPHVYRSALLLVEEEIAFNNNVFLVFSLSL